MYNKKITVYIFDFYSYKI